MSNPLGMMADMGGLFGPGGMAASLIAGAVDMGGLMAMEKTQMQQSIALQEMNIATNMFTTQLTSMASQQKTLMDAMAGIGSAYSNGAASIQGAIYATNNELGKIFSKAGGH